LKHPGFFERAGPFPLGIVADKIGATVAVPECSNVLIHDVRPLKSAGNDDITFLDNRKYLGQLATTAAGACILRKGDVDRAPGHTAVLATPAPYTAFARALALFYPDAMLSKAAHAPAGRSSRLVAKSAEIAEGVVIEPGAIVGDEARIGRGSVIAAGAVIGYRSVIGENCYIGAGSTVIHAILGDRVIIHPGVRIGQDGFGFAMSASGHQKVPQIGAVEIGNDVEIGANTTIDRGALSNTTIGDGTKIDNLVQIAHNVVIGRHCIIVAQTGLAGSAVLEDFVVMGARSGVVGHVTVGRGAQIAGGGIVKNNVPPGARMGGVPAKPFKAWARELAAVKRLGERSPRDVPESSDD